MITYLLKWLMASLVMPLLTALIGRFINEIIVLVFWPSSIFLMSLGAEKKPILDVIYVWGVAVGINIAIYLCIGLIVYYVRVKLGAGS
jgi:hypothetical protein